MAKPPPTPPSSDIQGVNRDARYGSPAGKDDDPAGSVQGAKEGAKARPEESKPLEGGTGDGPTE